MRDLSVTQEYLICAMGGKGKISGFDVKKLVCMVASALLELKMEDCIVLEKKKVRVTGELPAEKMYLKPLYDFINQPKPVKVEKIIEEYNYSFSDRKLRELIGAVEDSLAEIGIVTITESGIISKRKNYIPTKQSVHYVIDMIRSELLEDGEITEDIACLAALLERSKIIKEYFSAFEQKEIRHKLNKIINSDSGKLIKEMIDYIENLIAMMTALTVMYTN